MPVLPAPSGPAAPHPAVHVTLRSVVDEDHERLVALYAAGRAAELDQVAWPPGAREAFVRMQYEARERHYRAESPHGRFEVVEVDARFAGRLTVDLRDTDVRVVEIALLPEHCGQGVGESLLRDVLAQAVATGRTVSLHVEVGHRAVRLYERLGFAQVEEHGIHRLLRWEPTNLINPINPSSPTSPISPTSPTSPTRRT